MRFAAITQPANSYRVSLEKDEQGTQRLVWHTEEDGKPVDYTDEPGNAWREFEVDVMSVLPIESQL